MDKDTWPFEDASKLEYNDVVRVSSNILYPQGYIFIHASDPFPLPVFEYIRDMTLARGRILYEVHDPYTTRFLGYIAPRQIYNEALADRSGAPDAAWKKLPPDEFKNHQSVYRRLLDRFPRTTPIAAKIITESIVLSSLRPSNQTLEERVVKHCRHYWTSYDFRLETAGVTCEEVLKAVKPRMRSVLRKWLPADLAGGQLADFWWRHHLLDQDKSEKAEGVTKDVFYTPSVTQWYGGAELPVNLYSEPHAFL